MKKRVFAFFIVLSMAVLLCACQGKDQKDSDIQITDTAQQESVTGRRGLTGGVQDTSRM